MNPLANAPRIASHFRFIRSRSRNGLTMVELLVAVVLTLIIMLAMIRAFKSSSDSIALGRTKMDMHNKVRVVTEQLRRDLQNATHIPNPRETNDGYFEIVEGGENDADHATGALSFLGDHDDILAMTVRSDGEPFRGRFEQGAGFVESYIAEVIWWVQHIDVNGNGSEDYDDEWRLYRRVLLVRPDLTTTAYASIEDYYRENDVSVRPDGAGGMVANSLEDLANRANRFAHNSTLFPHEIFTTGASSIFNRALSGDYEGFDLMLNNCVAFDVKVFDPTAEVFRPRISDGSLDRPSPPFLPEGVTNINQIVDYGDAGFVDVVTAFDPATYSGTPTGGLFAGQFITSFPQNGAYVDLGYDPVDGSEIFTNARWFNDLSFTRGYIFTNNPRTYCTWWNGYESDGIDQNAANGNGPGPADEGQDGIDQDSVNGVDDNGERETQPPYGYPIRSLEVRIRMLEKKSGEILQKTVRENFVPN